MNERTYQTRVQGIVCRQCTDIIQERLTQVRGVIEVETSYIKSRVSVRYDSDIVSEEKLNSVLESIGYPPGEKGAAGWVVDIFCLALMIALYFLFKYLPGRIQVPELKQGASLGFVFVVGLLTSTHCIGMCGGIMLSQTTNASLQTESRRKRSLIAGISYNGGRVLTAATVGTLFGALGNVITYTVSTKSMVFTLAGGLVLLIGLNMWGILPGLRALSPSVPASCSIPAGLRRRWFGQPLLIGLLTGIMPCGASYAMWVYSMSTGSALSGGLTMLVWSLGTVPLMLLFSVLGTMIPAKYSKWMVKISAVLVCALGLLMLIRGLQMHAM